MTDKPGMPPGGGDDAGGIMALLERVAGLMDSVQATQQRMEERQLELESTVKSIQADVVKLTNDHANTSSTVERLLEKTRKVSRHIKDVRVRVENQNVRVKKVEATQGDLLAKNKFRVVIYQVSLQTRASSERFRTSVCFTVKVVQEYLNVKRQPRHDSFKLNSRPQTLTFLTRNEEIHFQTHNQEPNRSKPCPLNFNFSKVGVIQ